MEYYKFKQTRAIINSKLFRPCFVRNKWSKLLCFNKACKNCYDKTLQSKPLVKCFTKDNIIHLKQWERFNINHPRFVLMWSLIRCHFQCTDCKKEYRYSPKMIKQKDWWCKHFKNDYSGISPKNHNKKKNVIKKNVKSKDYPINKLEEARKYYDDYSFTLHGDKLIIFRKKFMNFEEKYQQYKTYSGCETKLIF